MSEHIQRTIEDLQAKRSAIDDLIGRLEWFQREFPHAAAAVTSNGDGPTKALRTNKQTNKQTNKASSEPSRSAEPP